MRYYSADYVLPISSEPIKDGVVVTDEAGKIIKLGTKADFPSADIQYSKGILLPGFINTHCHLELSHMQGVCSTGTKLIPFISNVIKLREYEPAVIQEHIQIQDAKMWNSGIQAVGDISNTADTAANKEKSKIAYYTFVEMFDMMQPAMTEQTIANYRQVYADQSTGNGNRKSLVPHASYSVTPQLFEFINKANEDSATLSIHNSETAAENFMFRHGGGDFKKFFKSLGMSLDHFRPTSTNAINYVLKHLQPKKKNLFVHNTMTTTEDIKSAEKWSDAVYWATCPNANLYIENRLPNYQLFLDANAKMTLGTDSLMSNWQLDIWEEIKTIKKFQSYVPLKDLLQWATLNGAAALGYGRAMGSLEVGKQPGLVQVELEWAGEETSIFNSVARRVV